MGRLSTPLRRRTSAREYDGLFPTVIPRRRLRAELAGVRLPRDRPKTLTARVGAEPLPPAQTAPVQHLPGVLAESDWEAEALTTRWIERVQADPTTRAHAPGVRSSTRPATARTALRRRLSPGRQERGSRGTIAHGLVTGRSLWVDPGFRP